jgi:Protein of unknown function (DUF1580)
MLDLTAETLLPLSRAARVLPASRRGRPVNVSTLFRWVTKGTRGVRLEALRLGGQWFTSEEALRRFAARLTERSLGCPAPDLRPPSASRLAADRAGRTLEARGA